MLIHLTPVGVSGILGAWSGQLFQGRSGNFANALRMRRHALNIWLRAGGRRDLGARSAGCTNSGSSPDATAMNAKRAGVRPRPRPELFCTEPASLFRSGSGRPILSPRILRVLAPSRLERQIGCRYQTAWFLLHRLRRAMVNEVRSKLRGFVEADETIVGGPVRGKRGRAVTDLATKTLVFGAVEVIDYTDKRGEDAQKAGRIRLATTPRADGQSIKQFLAQNVEKRSSIRTDGWRGYSKSALSAYNHDQTPGMRASHVHRVFGNLKTWLNGTHHGVNPKYLQNYLDEFAFRFNRRKTPMAAFQTLLGLTSARSPIHYEELIQREPTG
jgi:hypothetical protein